MWFSHPHKSFIIINIMFGVTSAINVAVMAQNKQDTITSDTHSQDTTDTHIQTTWLPVFLFSFHSLKSENDVIWYVERGFSYEERVVRKCVCMHSWKRKGERNKRNMGWKDKVSLYSQVRLRSLSWPLVPFSVDGNNETNPEVVELPLLLVASAGF